MGFVLVGALLFAAVCATAIALAVLAERRVRASRHLTLGDQTEYVRWMRDKHDLNRFGLAQQLRRGLGGLSSFGASFNVMSLIGSSAVLFGPALMLGGPAVIGYGWPIVALFSLAVCASQAEIASAVPTAGGCYHWAAALGGRRWGWYAGWLHLSGYGALLVLVNVTAAGLLDAYASQRFGYTPGALTFWSWTLALFGTQAAAHHAGIRLLAAVHAAGAWLQALLAVAIIAGLVWIVWPGTYPADWLYRFDNPVLGTEGDLWAFAAGTLLLMRAFIGGDAAGHAGEETVDPRIRVPWGMFLSAAYVAVIGFVLLAFMALSWGAGADAAGGSLFLQLALAPWKAAGPVVAAGIALALWFSGFAVLGTASRSLFALARDQAAPRSFLWAQVSAKSHMPVRAIWLVTAAGLACAVLLDTAVWLQRLSPVSFTLAFVMLCLHIAYAIPIGLKLTRRDRWSRLEADAPWRLGGWGKPLGWIAFVWLLLTAAAAVYLFSVWAAAAAAIILLVVIIMDFRYGKRHKEGLENASRRTRDEIIRMERTYRRRMSGK
jgi:amino acid transporter